MLRSKCRAGVRGPGRAGAGSGRRSGIHAISVRQVARRGGSRSPSAVRVWRRPLFDVVILTAGMPGWAAGAVPARRSRGWVKCVPDVMAGQPHLRERSAARGLPTAGPRNTGSSSSDPETVVCEEVVRSCRRYRGGDRLRRGAAGGASRTPGKRAFRPLRAPPPGTTRGVSERDRRAVAVPARRTRVSLPVVPVAAEPAAPERSCARVRSPAGRRGRRGAGGGHLHLDGKCPAAGKLGALLVCIT